MNRRLLMILVVFTCVASAVSPAGAGDKSTFNFGPKVGANISYQWGGNLPADLGEAYAGIIGGLFLRARLLDILMIQPELLYSQQGGKDIHIDYIQIPVLVKLGIPIGSLTPNIFVAPMGCFKVSDNANELIGKLVNLDVKDALFSIGFGAGVDIDVGSFLLTVEGRWTMSTMESFTTNVGFLTDSTKNGTGSILIGFGF
jgi:hypothetical protein